MMRPLLRSASFVFLLSSLGLAGYACGGKTTGGGSSGSSSGGSGSSSGGGSSGSGGGGSSGSGGGSSSSGGSSSGSVTCPVTPGEGACVTGESCNYGSGCDQVSCSCTGPDAWACSGTSCPGETCPADPPSGACDPSEVGQMCDYPLSGGCGPQCTCEDQGGGPAWACVVPPCPPPVCPTNVPSSGSACDSEGLYCYFPEDAGCFGATCVCETSGQWSCSKGDFCDAGVEQGD